jgi:hypothetical protein
MQEGPRTLFQCWSSVGSIRVTNYKAQPPAVTTLSQQEALPRTRSLRPNPACACETPSFNGDRPARNRRRKRPVEDDITLSRASLYRQRGLAAVLCVYAPDAGVLMRASRLETHFSSRHNGSRHGCAIRTPYRYRYLEGIKHNMSHNHCVQRVVSSSHSSLGSQLSSGMSIHTVTPVLHALRGGDCGTRACYPTTLGIPFTDHTGPDRHTLRSAQGEPLQGVYRTKTRNSGGSQRKQRPHEQGSSKTPSLIYRSKTIYWGSSRGRSGSRRGWLSPPYWRAFSGCREVLEHRTLAPPMCICLTGRLS